MPKLLIVEDNELNRDMLSRRLKRKGFEVAIATDGLQGVAMALELLPDLILLDMSLPVMDGWTAARTLKADPRSAAIPIIALTAHAMASDRDKALSAGCDEYDTKPVSFKRLLSKIEELLASESESASASASESASASDSDSESESDSESVARAGVVLALCREDAASAIAVALPSLEYDTLIVHSDAEALDCLEQRSVDVLLVESSVPFEGTAGMLERLSAESPGVAPEVIVATRRGNGASEQGAPEQGASERVARAAAHHICVPLQEPALLRLRVERTLERALRRRRLRAHGPAGVTERPDMTLLAWRLDTCLDVPSAAQPVAMQLAEAHRSLTATCRRHGLMMHRRGGGGALASAAGGDVELDLIRCGLELLEEATAYASSIDLTVAVTAGAGWEVRLLADGPLRFCGEAIDSSRRVLRNGVVGSVNVDDVVCLRVRYACSLRSLSPSSSCHVVESLAVAR